MNYVPTFLAVAALVAGASIHSPSLVSPESDVYAALLDSLGIKPLPDTLLLGDSSWQFRAPTGGVPAWRAQFDLIPAELPGKLELASRIRVSSLALALPRPAVVVTRAELGEIFAAGPSGWTEFYRRYPKQRGYIQLSPVVFSTDSLDALVYYDYHCGGLCGGGDAVWLRRQSTTDRWRVRKVVTFWVS